LVGLFIGILATSIVQSSSSTTSIVVGLVAGGPAHGDEALVCHGDG
jgi:Na+/phosphate symporter